MLLSGISHTKSSIHKYNIKLDIYIAQQFNREGLLPYYILYLKDQIKILSDAYLLYVVRSRWYDKVVMDAFKEIKIELEYKKYELNTIYYYKKRGWEI